MSFLSGWIGRGRKFEASLADYDLFEFPHAGEGKDLTAKQQQDNLDYLLKVKDDRCRQLVNTLAAFGVEIPMPSEVTNYKAVSRTLHDFSQLTLAHVRKIEAICAPNWRERSRTGRDARIASFVTDLGIYCGECTTYTDLGFDWRIDDTDYKPADRMPTAGLAVLSHISRLAPHHFRLYHDVLDWTFYRVADDAKAKAGRSLPMVHSFSFLDHLMDGRY